VSKKVLLSGVCGSNVRVKKGQTRENEKRSQKPKKGTLLKKD
jgi:hypothetical protein